MDFTISLADKLDPIAIYAAVVATLLLIWDIVKWKKSGAILNGSASPNMIVIGTDQPVDNTTYVTVDVSNRGSQPTTIYSVGLMSYSNLWNQVFDKPSKVFLISHSLTAYPLPNELRPGSVFKSRTIQNDSIVEMSKSSRLWVTIHHSASDKPFKIRIHPI